MFLAAVLKALPENTGLLDPGSGSYDLPMARATAKDRARDVRDRLENVLPLEDRKVRVFWRSGSNEVIDLKPLLIRFLKRPVASRDLLFRTAKPSEDGASVVWDDGSEISVSWLRDLALAHMTNDEFREAMRTLVLNGEEIAAHLGVSRRTVAGYRTDRDIPRAVALAVRFLLQRRAPKD